MKRKLAWMAAYAAVFFGSACLSAGGCLVIEYIRHPWPLLAKPFDDGANWEGSQNTPTTSRYDVSGPFDDGHAWKE